MKWSTSPHRPPHLYVDGAWYFITSSTVGSVKILSTDAHLNLWVETFKELILQFKIKLIAWVILPNHYHILFMPEKADELGSFMKRLNGNTSRKLNLFDDQAGRSVWYSYWDTCIRNERDFWTRFNYIHYNPVKHGYVEYPGEWRFSSYSFYLRDDESPWLEGYEKDFPIYDLFDDDRF
ncbi:MAG TPA: transposase [Anaerolineales bacterium]|nr:transposase [Anaerolineales bacterium]